MHEYNQKPDVEKYLNYDIQLCTRRKCGFSLKENKSDSCRYHPYSYNPATNYFQTLWTYF